MPEQGSNDSPGIFTTGFVSECNLLGGHQRCAPVTSHPASVSVPQALVIAVQSRTAQGHARDDPGSLVRKLPDAPHIITRPGRRRWLSASSGLYFSYCPKNPLSAI